MRTSEMRIPLSVLALCAVCANAGAQPPVQAVPAAARPSSVETSPPRFALGLSLPLGWLFGWFGASGYARITEHVGVRVNVATWTGGGPGGAPGTFISSFESGYDYGGRIVDLGIGAVVYPRRTLDGPMLEVGAFRRGRNTYVWPDFDPKTTTRSTTYAGRALVGWSWLMRSNVFVAFAIGGSWGRESGRTSMDNPFGMTTTATVRRERFDGESYLRLGILFGS
jgi:hypothetical protein